MAKTKAGAKQPDSKNLAKNCLKAKKRKFCTYSNASLQAALQAIRESGISVREASKRYGVPRATLHDKFTGKSTAERKKTGPPPKLTVEGEKKIADRAINLAKCGFPISKADLMEVVAKIANDTGMSKHFPNAEPGIRWYKGFLKRHPEIYQREAEGINKARALVTEESIRSWFCSLKKYLEDNNFQDVLEDPSRIYNGDESGFSLCPKTGKVLGPKGWKNLYVIKSGKEKENITVLITFNASGTICPPLVVFPYVRPPQPLVKKVPPNWVIGKSETGWMTQAAFFEYVSNDFDSWLTANEIKRPILLLIDGHKSHMSMPLSQFCDQHGIILYALPPNTTHILQPADVSVFKPMKQEWKNTVKNWQKRSENLNQVITKINFCSVFEETLQKTEMQSHIVKGFRKCGLYPFNPEAVDYTKCVKNILQKNCLQQTSSTSASEQTLTENDFDAARRVIESISNELKNYDVNVDIIITEIDFQKSLLKNDSKKIGASTSTTISADQVANVAVGSIVPMDRVTLLPVEITEIEEGMLLSVGNSSSNELSVEHSTLEVFSESENIPQDIEDGLSSEELSANKSETASENRNHIKIIESDDYQIVTENLNEKDNREENKICNEKEKDNENDTGNGEENAIGTESRKKPEKEIEGDIENPILNKNDKDNEKGNSDKTENWEVENGIYRNGKEKGNENDTGNEKGNEMETESGKNTEKEVKSSIENGTVIKDKTKNENKGDKEENDRENKQENEKENLTDETEKHTYKKNSEEKFEQTGKN